MCCHVDKPAARIDGFHKRLAQASFSLIREKLGFQVIRGVAADAAGDGRGGPQGGKGHGTCLRCPGKANKLSSLE